MLARRACFSASADPDTRARQGVQSRLTPLPRSSPPFSRSSRTSVGSIFCNLSRAHGNRKDVARRARYRVRNRPGLYVPFLLPFLPPEPFGLLLVYSQGLGDESSRLPSTAAASLATGTDRSPLPLSSPPLPFSLRTNPSQPSLPPNAL